MYGEIGYSTQNLPCLVMPWFLHTPMCLSTAHCHLQCLWDSAVNCVLLTSQYVCVYCHEQCLWDSENIFCYVVLYSCPTLFVTIATKVLPVGSSNTLCYILTSRDPCITHTSQRALCQLPLTVSVGSNNTLCYILTSWCACVQGFKLTPANWPDACEISAWQVEKTTGHFDPLSECVFGL